MVKKLPPILLVLLLAACSAGPAPAQTPSAGQLAAEEQAVYAALIKGRYPAGMVVLMAETATDAEGNGNLDRTLQYVLQNMHSVSPQTIDRFKAGNAAAQPLEATMQLGVPYVLLGHDDITALFNVNQDGWQLFYERYPQARGILTFSRAGFDDALDQALVYVGVQSQALAGAGHYVLLKKVNGVWMVDQEVMVWIS